MPTYADDPVVSVNTAVDKPAIYGESKTNEGVRGLSRSGNAGVVGINHSTDPRIAALPRPGGPEVTTGGPGGWFESNYGEGVRGWSKHADHGGVVGVNTAAGIAVYGKSAVPDEDTPSEKQDAVGGIAVYGTSKKGIGVWGISKTNEAVHAETHSGTTAAIAAYQKNTESTGAALYAKHDGNLKAAMFEGSIEVTGNIDVTGLGSDIRLINQDCAEEFDVCGANKVEPGTVMVLGDEGTLMESQQAYDKRVAGVISGAGDYKPAIVLDGRKTPGNRQPVALMGKVFCKVDAQFGSVQVGDLLTTSPTPGHAMVASESVRAFGTIIGKALRPLLSGKGLVPILVALQ